MNNRSYQTHRDRLWLLAPISMSPQLFSPFFTFIKRVELTKRLEKYFFKNQKIVSGEEVEIICKRKKKRHDGLGGGAELGASIAAITCGPLVSS